MGGEVCVKTPAEILGEGMLWPVLMAKDVTGSKQMGKHHRMCGLRQDWEVCAVIRPHHRWLISRGLLP